MTPFAFFEYHVSDLYHLDVFAYRLQYSRSLENWVFIETPVAKRKILQSFSDVMPDHSSWASAYHPIGMVALTSAEEQGQAVRPSRPLADRASGASS